MDLGLPYARAVPGGRVCPICHATIPEEYDPQGEIVSNNYGTHYIVRHQPPIELEDDHVPTPGCPWCGDPDCETNCAAANREAYGDYAWDQDELRREMEDDR